MADLRLRWLHALDSAADAVQAAVRTHAFAAGEGRAWLDRLRAERAWVDDFEWRS